MAQPGRGGNSINFDGNYEYAKLPLPRPKSAELLQVFRVRYGSLSKPFMGYNNRVRGGGPAYHHPKNPIAPGDYALVLVFYEPATGHVFTSVRKWKRGKAKYTAHVGETFKFTYRRDR